MRTSVKINKYQSPGACVSWSSCTQTLCDPQAKLTKSSLDVPKKTTTIQMPNVDLLSISSTLEVSQINRQLNNSDSIGCEMTHFKPIRFMPISGVHTTEKLLKIPTVRYKEFDDDPTLHFTPIIESKFKPDVTFKFRGSAFCLVNTNVYPKPFTTSNAATSVGSNATTKQSNRKDIENNGNLNRIEDKNSYSVLNTKKSKEKLMCNIVLDKTKYEKILLQEKKDFELAKMLQDYVSNNDICHMRKLPPSSTATSIATLSSDAITPRSTRYFLRTRNKPNLKVETSCDVTPTAPPSSSSSSSRTNSAKNGARKTVNGNNRQKTKKSATRLNGITDKKITRTTRSRVKNV